MDSSLILGDCLDVLSNRTLPFFDLIYLDPPFCTQKSHALSTRDGSKTYQYSDQWSTKAAYAEFIKLRLSVFHKALKDTGSIFFHCDTSASHIARNLLDDVFGEENFVSEIIWHYRRWTNSQKAPIPSHQTIFFYSKSPSYKFNQILTEYSETTNADQILQKRARDSRNKSVYATDENGSILVGGAKKGVPISDVWEIPFLNPKATERVGYPTQKPILLLERIIELVTDPGDWVLDPFCGSGTTVVAAHLTGRNAVGIDISQEAITLSETRLREPKKTESKLLANGRNAYLPKELNVQQVLSGLDYVPIARNKGLDAILKAELDGRPVFVRVQREHESVSDAACTMRKAAIGKGKPWLIVVATSDITTSLYEETALFEDVFVVASTTLAIQREIGTISNMMVLESAK
jgi:site-specific DNA-methyltransferase (adenine-specific)